MIEILSNSKIIAPEIFLIVGILILVLIATIAGKKNLPNIFFYFSVLLILTYISFSFSHYIRLVHTGTKDIFGGLLIIDKIGLFFKEIAALSAFVFLIHSRIFSPLVKAEIYILVFHLLLGVIFLSMTSHFFIIYICIELISLCAYMLVASGKLKQNFEASIKYLIFGATSSAIMLFGISLFYGITHSFNFNHFAELNTITSNSPLVINIISFLVFGGLLFKAGLAPFHIWVPDIYEATATPVLSFLSFAPKAAAFVLMARYINGMPIDLRYLIMALASLSLLIGNFSALWQSHLKRLLGYSSIAQAGFMLIGLINIKQEGFYATFYYILAYLPITMGSFFLVDVLFKKVGSYQLEAFNGLGRKNVVLGVNTVIIMMALIGLPPTIGFMAKLMIFSTIAVKSSSNSINYSLILFGLLNAAVSIYYYLKLPYNMIIKKSDNTENDSDNFIVMFVLSYFSFIIIYFFVFPESFSTAINGLYF